MADIEKARTTAADKLPLKIAISQGNHRGRVKGETVYWPDLVAKLERPITDNITAAEFRKLPEKARQNRKNQGYFVAGVIEGRERKVENLRNRCGLTYDIDNCTPELAADLLDPENSPFAEYEHFVHTTRSHTPESPRLRLIFPLAREVTSETFEAAARILAWTRDPTMKMMDPVSYRPMQVMYWPTINADSEFLHKRIRGRLLDPHSDLFVGEWESKWNDIEKLPYAPGEPRGRAHVKKAPDPREKRGYIGAWCRTYTIHETIELFLSDIYAPTDENGRYSYLKGTSVNGAVTYDDIWLWSHHGSDPAQMRLLHGGDLYRIHKYGHLDSLEDIEDAEEARNPTLLPSYKAFVQELQDDPKFSAVMQEYTQGQFDLEAMADDFDAEDDDGTADNERGSIADEAAEAVAKPSEPAKKVNADWMQDLDKNEKGAVKSNLHNVILILQNDARFKGALAYNDLIEEPVVVRRIMSKQYGHSTRNIRNRANGDLVDANVRAVTRAILEAPRGEGKTGWGLRVSDRDLDDAMARVAQGSHFHPIQRYLKKITWDGVPRIKTMLQTYWHATGNPEYLAQVASFMMVAAVARVFEPGHKFDFVVILEGPQGIRKSSSCSVLGGIWFTEFSADIHRTDKVVENVKGKWIVELPELTVFLRYENEALKALFSMKDRRVRLAWARSAIDFSPQCIFIGSTNNDEYLRDKTGNRRYWPVKLPGRLIDLESLRENRDQLWAEAYETYLWFRRAYPAKQMDDLPLYLTGAAAKAAEQYQGERMVPDAAALMEGEILEFLATPHRAEMKRGGYLEGEDIEDGTASPKLLLERVCIKFVAFHVWGTPPHKVDTRLARDIGQVLSGAPGWRRGDNERFGRPLGKQKSWHRESDL